MGTFTNSVHPDEMQHNVDFISVFTVCKGKKFLQTKGKKKFQTKENNILVLKT